MGEMDGSTKRGPGTDGIRFENFLKRLGRVCLLTEILCESYIGSL